MKKLLTLLTCLLLLTSLQGQILRYSNYVAPGGGDTTNYYSVYKTIYDEMTTPPGHDTAHFQSAMVYSLDSMAIWGRLKLFYVFATAHSNSTYINWANPGTYDLTDPGTTAPPFTAYQGIDPDGSSDYLSTTWIPYTDSTLVGNNNITLASWQLGNVDATAVSMGTIGSGYGLQLFPQTSDNIRARLNSGTTSALGDPTSSIGLTMATRRGDADEEGYKDGASTGTDNDASTGLTQTYPLWIFANNNAGTAEYFFNPIVSIILVMNGVTDDEADKIYDILHHYMTHIGQ